MANLYRIPFSPPSSRLQAILGEEPDLLSMAATTDLHLTDATIPIPEEESIMSEGFQGDRIQGTCIRLAVCDHVMLACVLVCYSGVVIVVAAFC